MRYKKGSTVYYIENEYTIKKEKITNIYYDLKEPYVCLESGRLFYIDKFNIYRINNIKKIINSYF